MEKEKKHKCSECHQPISDEEFSQFIGLCSGCMAKKINEMRNEARRNLNKSPH